MNEQTDLSGTRVAVLVADGFEEPELTSPIEKLRSVGAEVSIVSPVEGKKVRAWDGSKSDWGEKYDIDCALNEADPHQYDALVLPGGVINPDTLRTQDQAILFIRSFFQSGKPVAAICHGPQLLIEAVQLADRKLTSYPSIKTDLCNAGAGWVDKEVVVDENLITSRTPDDLPAFNKALIEMLQNTAVGA